VFDELLLSVGQVDEQVKVGVSFAQKFVTYTASYEENLSVEGRFGLNLVADEA
jgi:hypothetical protein